MKMTLLVPLSGQNELDQLNFRSSNWLNFKLIYTLIFAVPLLCDIFYPRLAMYYSRSLISCSRTTIPPPRLSFLFDVRLIWGDELSSVSLSCSVDPHSNDVENWGTSPFSMDLSFVDPINGDLVIGWNRTEIQRAIFFAICGP